MNNKRKKNSITNVIVIVIVFSLLQTYLLFLDQFATVVMATTQSSVLDSIYIPENKANSETVLSEENTDQNFEETGANNIPEVVQETASAENEETDSDEELTAEFMDSALEIMKSYKFSDGIVLQVKISDELANIKSNLDSGNIKISVPNLEGYSLRNTYIDEVSLDSEDFDYEYSVTGTKEVVINLTKKDKSSVESDDLIVVSENYDNYQEYEKDNENEEIIETDNEEIDITSIENDITGIGVNEDEVNEEIDLVNISAEYIITYVFDGEVEVGNISLSKEIDLNYPEKDVVNLNTEFKADISIEEKEENTYSISAENASMYKGYMYANAVSSIGYETKYTSINEVELTSIENIDNIVITDLVDNIITKDGSQVSLAGYGLYKETKVNVEEFSTIFGNDGYIEVFSSGRAIGRIDSSTQIVDDNYVFTYKENLSNVEFSLNNMVGIGNLKILNDKVISKDSPFNRTQIMNFSKIVSEVITQEYSKTGETQVKLFEESKNLEINLEDTESKMDLQMDVNSLSTSIDNEVTFTVTLKTNEEKYDLFTNPEIRIELPSDITNVEIVNINLLYKNGLSVDKFEVIDGEYGNKIIRIKLAGTQEEYTPGLISSGTTINLYTKLTLNRLTTNKNSKIEFKYTNELDSQISYEVEGKDSVELPIEFVSKQGLLRASKLENILTGLSTENYDTEISSIKLEDHTSNQIVNYKGTIVNNFETTLNNVTVIGRLPVIGNTDESSNDLGTTFDSTLNSEIITSGSIAEVYYSEDIYADINSSTWTKDISDFSNIKSYKIVLTNNEMKQGDYIDFSCSIKIPDNLDNNQKAYTIYSVYYDLDNQTLFSSCTSKMFTSEKEISIDDISSENKENVAQLVVGTVVTQCENQLSTNDNVYERQALEYTIIVTNNSNVVANNIVIKANAENANLYYLKKWIEKNYEGEDEYELCRYTEDIDGSKGYEEFSIDTLNPKESKIFKYQVIVKDLSEVTNPEVYGKITVSGDNFEEFNMETIRNNIIDADCSIITAYATTENENDTIIYALSPLRFQVEYTNISDKKIENANLRIFISNELQLNNNSPIEGAEEYNKNITETTEGTIIDITIPEIEVGEKNYLYLYTYAKDFDNSMLTEEANIYSLITYGDNTYYSNNYTRTIQQFKSNVDYTWSVDKSKDTEVSNGDTLTYTLNLKNTGLLDITDISTELEIDSGLELQKVTFSKGSTNTDIDCSNVTTKKLYSFSLLKNEEATITYNFVVNELTFEVDQSTIETKVNITSTQIDDITTDVIAFNIKKDETNNTSNSNNSNNSTNTTIVNNQNNKVINSNDDEEQGITENTSTESITTENTPNITYEIFGKVWLDKNKDGIYSSNETGMKSINVSIYGISNNEVDMNKKYGSTTTDSDGNYEFKNLENGKYIVIFEYDNELYTVTKYQDSKAKSNENSDVISKTLSDSKTKVGMTDVIEISDKSMQNIDMGLIQINDFDMSLSKYISKTTVTNSKGESIQQYSKDSLVKLEINSKLFESSIVNIEYKIIVKNEGELDGYVNKIVDYLPEGLEFNKDLNKDWSLSDDGNLVYTGLIDKAIKPDESKEITLILTTQMKNFISTTIKNSAEIQEVTNERGFQDIDSTEGNKIEDEDDYGSVSLLITVATGKIINYALIIIFILVVVIVYAILKISLKKKIYK